jgi:hypothetical protein
VKIYISYDGDEQEIGDVEYGAARISPDLAARRIEEIADDMVGNFSPCSGVAILIK